MAVATRQTMDPLLRKAIMSATKERIQKVLLDVASRSRETEELVVGYLLVDADLGSDGSEPDTPNPEIKATSINADEKADYDGPHPFEVPQRSLKRRNEESEDRTSVKRRRFEICEQCEEEYDVTTNSKTSCLWHPGDCELKDDWEDNYECLDEWDTPEPLLENAPHFFAWTCCDEPGDTSKKGCEWTKHQPQWVA